MHKKYYNNFDISTVHIKYNQNFFNSLMRNIRVLRNKKLTIKLGILTVMSTEMLILP